MSSSGILKPGNVAVVTGAALGIGREIGRRFAAAGLKVVLVDLEGPDLTAAAEVVMAVARAGDRSVFVMATDVAAPDQVKRLRAQVEADVGVPQVLVNAAVSRQGRGMDADLADWRHAMEVNLWGPVEMVRAFLPAMRASGDGGWIVNVGSKQGITNPPGHPIYNIAKAALKTYTEALEHELRSDVALGGRITTHLLVPGWTTTGKAVHKVGAWLPAQVVEEMLTGIERGDFYIVCPDGEVTAEMDKRRILWAAGDITENRPPLSRWHPDFAAIAKDACS